MRRLQRFSKGILIVTALALPAFAAKAGVDANGAKGTETTAEEAPPEYNNWITLGPGGIFVIDDDARFQHRHWLKEGFFGGLEELHVEPAINDKITLKIDGRALAGAEDYLAGIDLAVRDVGYLKAGYRKFRTWYDGHGGYFPPNDLFIELYNNELWIDRDSLYVELGLRVPKWPEITFRYERQSREGRKDSTIWGDSALTGLPGTTNVRGIVPAFYSIDETRDIFTFDIRHTIGKTEAGLGLRYEEQDNDNSRNVHRRPGEAQDRFFTQRDNLSADLFSLHAYQTTRLSPQVQFSTAYMYTTLDSEIGGDRIYGSSYEPIFDPLYDRRQRRDEGFVNMFGGSQLSQHVATLNLAWRPSKDWVIIPSFRYEHNDLDSVSNSIETVVPPTGPLVAILEPLQAQSERSFDAVTEAIEVRFTGVKNWSFYLKGEWMQEELDQIERDFELEEETASLLIGRDTAGDIQTQKYVLGANWYAHPAVTIATQYYKKIHENEYDHPFDTTANVGVGDRYPAFLRDHDFYLDDFNVRVTWRPIPTLTSVSRYDFQLATIDTRGDFLETVESADITAHILSETITWNPVPRLYLQGSVHYVRNETDTPSEEQIGAIVQDMKNNYWNGTLAAGYALGDRTDLRVNYSYYRADNFEDNSTVSLPYGSDAEEHAVTATLTHDFSSNLRGTLRYGFFNNCTEAYGNRHNYDAHMVATSLQYRF